MNQLIKFSKFSSYLPCLKHSINSYNKNIFHHTAYKFKTNNIHLHNVQQSVTTHTINYRNERLVGKWMLCCGGMVYIAVMLGGVTRLTESGLSMVSWKLMGEKLPHTNNEWLEEFKQYQQYPEFKMKNQSMSLEEFKFIFWMEYLHRMWGRAIGAAFLLPAIYFWRKRYFTWSNKKVILLIGLLIGCQGLMGWYMVKSGLENRFDDLNTIPRVSQHRLALHLSAAFVIYTLFLTQGLKRLFPPEELRVSTSRAIIFRRLVYVSKGLIFLTALSGALVAGLDAGLVYNSFPKMGDHWIPDDVWSHKPFNRNFTENPVTVQLNHRILGLCTVILVTSLWVLSKRTPLPIRGYRAINAAMIVAWLQVALGISTLLNHVPVTLAAAHQSGSLLLLSCAVWLSQELRLLKYIPK